MLDKSSTFLNVIKAIKEEKEYQDKLWGNRYHSPAEWILFMQNYLREAEDLVCRMDAPKCNEDAMHIIRKVATMAVCCMEQNGVAHRDMKDLEKSCELHGVNCKEKENE